MDTPDLDFKEPPRSFNVPFDKFHDFCALANARHIIIHSVTPKPGVYRLQTNTPLSEDMRHLTVPD